MKLLKATIPPPESWQYPISCSISVEEVLSEVSHKCDYCTEQKSNIIDPSFETEILSNPSSIKKDYIEDRVRNAVAKVYKGRCICDSPKCKTKFDNEIAISFNRKGYLAM